jgi:hypothetical protein
MVTSLWRRLVEERDEDLVPLLVSWGIALSAGAAWLAVVHLTATTRVPVREPVLPVDNRPIAYEPGRIPFPDDVSAGNPKVVIGTKNAIRPAQLAIDVANAFAGTTIGRKVAADMAELIDRVETVGHVTATILNGDKSTLKTAAAHGTPGAAKIGENTAAARGRIGSVTPGNTVPRAEVHMKTLSVVAAPAPDGGTIDATEAGAFVRARVAELQYCYARSAGGADSQLAGVATLRLVLGDNGAVRGAEVVRRTWSGPAAEETESCLLAAARRWRVPGAAAGATLTLPISFTRGR